MLRKPHWANSQNVSTHCRGRLIGRQKNIALDDYTLRLTKDLFMTKIQIIGTIVMVLSIISFYFSFFFFIVDIQPVLSSFLLRTICVIMNLSLIAGILAFIKTKIPDKTVLIINRIALTILIGGYIFGIIIIDAFANDKP